MTGAAIIGSVVASYNVKVMGYKHSFLFIAVFAFILALAGIFLKSRKSELLTVAKAVNIDDRE